MCNVYLAFRYVVPSEGADDEAGVAGVRLGAVAGEAGASHHLALLAVGGSAWKENNNNSACDEVIEM